ncbi:MAG: TonB-dependent receptor [Pseudomonadota bacterium]
MQGTQQNARTSILLWLFAIALWPAPLFAQALENERFDFDIAAMALDAALLEFTAVTRRTVSADAKGIEDLRSNAVSGNLAPAAALAQMIDGNGLELLVINNAAFALRLADNGQLQAEPASQAEPVVEIEELIIYGTKENKPLQETQTSVALYTAERIEQDALFTLDDIILRTPNVSVINAQTSFSIRGIGQSGVGFAGTGLTSNVYVDNAPLSGNAQNGAQSLWDVQQVEVLRGPQSTVQGRNALSGALIMQTNDPTYDWTFRLRGQLASEDSERASLALSGPIIDEQLAFRLAVDYQTYDGGVEEVVTGFPQEFQDAYTYRGKLLIEPEALPGFRAELKVERVETDFGEFNTRFAPVPFTDPTFSDFDEYGDETFTRVRFEETETDLFGLEISQSLGPHWTLIGIATYEDQFRQSDFCDTRAGSCALFSGPNSTEQTTAELRLAFNYDRVSGWLGAYYFDQETKRQFDIELPVALFPFPATPPDATVTTSSRQRETIDNTAIFADVTFKLNDQWSFNLGARYDREEFFDSGSQGTATSSPANCIVTTPFGALPCSTLLPVAGEPSTPAEFEAFLPRAGVTYRFDAKRSLSFAVQRGYRAGGAELVALPGTGVLTPVEFDPEFVTNYELAFRSEWYDNRLTVNANVFYLDWTDQQVTIPGASGNPLAQDAFVDNAGESTVYGLELSTSFKPNSQLDLFGSLGLLRTEFTDFPFAPLDPSGQFTDLSGNAFPAAPEVSASIGLNYEHSSGFYTNWTASYQSDRESDVTNLSVNALDSFVVVNARVGMRWRNINTYLFANNLLDDRFATRLEFAGIDPATGALDVRPNARFQINEPRIVGVSMELEF